MRFLIVAAILAGLSPIAAFAQAAPIDMTVALHDGAGKPLNDPATQAKDDPACERCTPLTIGRVVANALYQVEQGAAGADLVARGQLAAKLMNEKAAVLSADETAAIKKLVIKLYPSPLVLMQVLPVIDPSEKPGSVKP